MAIPTKILLTGFEPFGGMATNPSEELVRAFERERPEGVSLDILILPVEYQRAMEMIRQRVAQYDIVVMFGVARTRQEISVERVAINLMDASSRDNCGYRPEEEPIDPDGPAAYFTTLPVKQIARETAEAGIPCKVSNTAGTYVCNAIYYSALHEAAVRGYKTRCLFIHLPAKAEINSSFLAYIKKLDI